MRCFLDLLKHIGLTLLNDVIKFLLTLELIDLELAFEFFLLLDLLFSWVGMTGDQVVVPVLSQSVSQPGSSPGFVLCRDSQQPPPDVIIKHHRAGATALTSNRHFYSAIVLVNINHQ